MLDGEPGAWPKFIGHWLLRSALIMPGLVVAGVRDKRVFTGALASSTLVSLFLMLYTVVERGRRGQTRRLYGMSTKKRYRLTRRTSRSKFLFDSANAPRALRS